VAGVATGTVIVMMIAAVEVCIKNKKYHIKN